MEGFQLLCDISELNHLFRDSVSVEGFLQKTVEMVTHRLKTDVCSIYLYDEEEDLLVMRATQGLHPDSVGLVRMKPSEGLTGKALRELRPICESRAGRHPDFKPFIGTNEELFDNFLAVPITRGLNRIGVLVLQRGKRRKFSDEDIMACKAVASQLANIIENARFLMTMHAPHEEKARPDAAPAEPGMIRGKTACAGFGLGPCRILNREHTLATLSRRDYPQAYSLADFDRAVRTTQQQLEDLQKRVEEKLSDAASLIFASHLLILKDHAFVGEMRKRIEKGINPPLAILEITRQYLDIFDRSESPYIREKVQDVEDLIVRLIDNLLQKAGPTEGLGHRVVIARELFPSDLLRMSSEEVAGAVLVAGGVTSHLSILARSLQIPMVIAQSPELLKLADGTPVLLDADIGNVYVRPNETILHSFRNRIQAGTTLKDRKVKVKPETTTRDGVRIRLMANINLLSDVSLAQSLQCDGVGLYRTEFPFIVRSDFPSEEEQYWAYRRLVESMGGKPVTFRTLDIGGDKVLSYYPFPQEQNPSMGMRSIRFSLDNRPIFLQQLRAILRAGAGADLRVMFPMIASLDDFCQARQLLRQAADQLKAEQIQHHAWPKVGMMVELPGVIPMIESLAAEVDFFSIGTNDLIQFMLGVDRTNEKVESYYIPHHPALFRSIRDVLVAAERHGREVSICGDMAHEMAYLTVLVGMGVRTLSVEPLFIPQIQQILSTVDSARARTLSEKVLGAGSVGEIERLLGIEHKA